MATGRVIHLLYRYKMAVSAILTTMPLDTAQHPVPCLQPYVHCKTYSFLPFTLKMESATYTKNAGNTL